MELVKYDAACRAIAEAKTIDDVKEITNRAEAARAYARQAKNRQLELDALEIRVRAERRLGEILLHLRKDGVFGQGRVGSPIKLADLGVDNNISGGAQRLTKLPADRFAAEINSWRDKAETAQRVEVPLQRFRIPSIVGDRQRVAARNGRNRIDPSDRLAKFTAMDGRRVADWRFGELDRIDEAAARIRSCVAILRAEMPIANPDPLDTMEMIFRDPNVLAAHLDPIWDRSLSRVDAGADPHIPDRRKCKNCGSEFVPVHKPHKDRPTEGQFCSHSCASSAQHRSKCGTLVAPIGKTASRRGDR